MRPARRPPDTPGWRFPVRYTLVWLGVFLVIDALCGLVVYWLVGARWLPLAVAPAGIITHGAGFAYERRPVR